MTQEEYEWKKHECWEEFCSDSCFFNSYGMTEEAFYSAFDRAYALGKQEQDAEGEEMLCVSRERVQEEYRESIDKAHPYNLNSYNRGFHVGCATMLKTLFGSKCMPDEAPLSQNPSENCDTENHISTDCDKPSKPKFTDTFTNDCKSRNISQETANCDKQFDNIPKDSFAKERRLNIAAMMAQGILSNTDRMKQYGDIAMRESETLTQLVARNAMRYADALIAEGEAKH